MQIQVNGPLSTNPGIAAPDANRTQGTSTPRGNAAPAGPGRALDDTRAVSLSDQALRQVEAQNRAAAGSVTREQATQMLDLVRSGLGTSPHAAFNAQANFSAGAVMRLIG